MSASQRKIERMEAQLSWSALLFRAFVVKYGTNGKLYLTMDDLKTASVIHQVNVPIRPLHTGEHAGEFEFSVVVNPPEKSGLVAPDGTPAEDVPPKKIEIVQ